MCLRHHKIKAELELKGEIAIKLTLFFVMVKKLKLEH